MPAHEDLPHPGPPAKVVIGPSSLDGAGRGMFATAPIAAGERIESCPVIDLPDRRDRNRLRRTGLVNYYFLWGERRDRAAICLGYGSLYNHSYAPNARYVKRVEAAQMDFYALRPIAAGEEITVNYNGVPDDGAPLWIASIPPANAAAVPNSAKRHPIRRRAALAAASAALGTAIGFAAHAYWF